jgi:formylmethanofuran dehydrogenase subunit E
MSSQISAETLERVIAFHGHLCPGLTLGVRAAEIALRELGPRAADEELVAVVETDSCAVDAIQVLLGCTFGKGNLIHLDYGKTAFTFARRDAGQALRVVAKPQPPRQLPPETEALMARVRAGQGSAADQEAYAALWRERALALMEAAEEDLFEVTPLRDYTPPERAQIHASVRCQRCGELVMAPRSQRLGARVLCLPCAQQEAAEGFLMRPIGVVHNELVPHQAPSRARSPSSTITIVPEFAPALLGLAPGDRLQIIYAFDKAPTDAPLQQRRRRDPNEPLRGVFALRSPHRPNPIGLTTVKLLAVEGNVLTVADLDAWDGTPVLDIKPYEPSADESGS